MATTLTDLLRKTQKEAVSAQGEKQQRTGLGIMFNIGFLVRKGEAFHSGLGIVGFCGLLLVLVLSLCSVG